MTTVVYQIHLLGLVILRHNPIVEKHQPLKYSIVLVAETVPPMRRFFVRRTAFANTEPSLQHYESASRLVHTDLDGSACHVVRVVPTTR